jgi:hypothetical protein
MTTLAERNRGFPILAITAAVGLLAGLLVFALTTAASQSDIGGPGWSLRGNGALIVPFGLLPSLLAAGWVWLAARSVTRAAIAGLVALALELAFGFGPILIGPGDPGATLKPGVAVLVLALLAGLALARVRRGGQVLVSVGITVAAILIALAPTGAAYFIVPILVPILLAWPVLGSRWTGRLAAESATLTAAMLLGAFGGQYLLGPR